MTCRCFLRVGLASLAALGVVSFGADARARDLVVESCAMPPCTTIGGVRLHDSVRIAAEAKVEEFDGTADTGWVHLKAHTIVVTADGLINAAGAGYRGSAEQNPVLTRGPGAGGTPNEIFSMTAAPGGGASHAGSGGIGTDSCTAFLGAEGGLTYNTDVNNPPELEQTMGSAGGASRSISNDYIGRGGNGGGGVILEAASITIDGTIRVNGETAPNNNLGDGPGGGSAGSIVIVANELTIGATARFEAVGGDGALAAQLFGGAGGGGLVVLSAPGDHSMVLASQVDVGGGAGATACCTVMMQPFSCGGDGLKAQIAQPECIDADEDGFANELCGGDDCNDGSASVNGDIAEICNGIDDNCDGQVDEPEAALCQAGFACVTEGCEEGKAACCQVPDASSSAAAGGGAADPPAVHFSGGLCSTSAPIGSHGRRLAPWALLLAVGAVAQLRRRLVKPTDLPKM